MLAFHTHDLSWSCPADQDYISKAKLLRLWKFKGLQQSFLHRNDNLICSQSGLFAFIGFSVFFNLVGML